MLLLVQESYLLYLNSDYKNLGYIIYTILKNHMQATLDVIIGEKQSAAIKYNNITHIFHKSTCNWCFTEVKQQPCLNIFEFFLIFHIVDWGFTAFVSLFYHKFVIRKFILPFQSLVMETNSFTRLKLHTAISNLNLKKMVYLNLLPLYEEFAKGVQFHTVICYCVWGTCRFHWCWYKD